MISTECQACQKTFKTQPAWVRRGRGKFCSKACKDLFQMKGGYSIHTGGYISVLVDVGDGKKRHRYQHRLTMEKVLGRSLGSSEIVHHLNGNPQDNRPENLEVMTQSRHAKLHRDGVTHRFKK